jgi:hypothetical protein
VVAELSPEYLHEMKKPCKRWFTGPFVVAHRRCVA